MLMFDAEIGVQDVSLGTPSPEALEAGVPPHVELGLIIGFVLPFANPQTGEPIALHGGRLKFTLPRQQAIEVFTAALNAAESLPETPQSSGKLLVANNMAAVEQAAQNIKRVTGR